MLPQQPELAGRLHIQVNSEVKKIKKLKNSLLFVLTLPLPLNEDSTPLPVHFTYFVAKVFFQCSLNALWVVRDKLLHQRVIGQLDIPTYILEANQLHLVKR